MAADLDELFDDMARRPYAPWMRRIQGNLRFDVVSGATTEHWVLSVGEDDLRLTREAVEADAVIRSDREVFDAIAAGRTRPIPAFLRNDITVKGGFRYLLLLDRLLPGSPRYESPDGKDTVS